MGVWYTTGMHKQYLIQLTDPEVTELQQLIHTGTHHARVQTRARILLLTHAGQIDGMIAATLLTSPAAVHRVRPRCARAGVAAALAERPRPGPPPLLTGEGETHLTLLACTQPPAGHARGTIQLLTERRTLCAVDQEPHSAPPFSSSRHLRPVAPLLPVRRRSRVVDLVLGHKR